MWIIGETETGAPPTFEWSDNFVKEKGVTFPVLRDYKFLQVYGAIDAHSNALPHQYLLDGETMELVWAAGGIPDGNSEALAEIEKLLAD
ncbi:MAG: hypothetical protein ACI9WU_002916 [Myxococcota bacterium]|jgi:hypothetical protein